MSAAQCACQQVQGLLDDWEQPSGPVATEREVIQRYRQADMTLRLSLYMQHRDLRGVFALVDKEER